MSNHVTICSSFTAEPLEPMLRLLFERTGVEVTVRFSPYSQVLQELLAANSTLRREDSMANVLLLRASDYLQGGTADDDAVRKSANEIASAVREYDAHNSVPLMVVVTKDKNTAANTLFEKMLYDALQGVPTAHTVSDLQIAEWYPVDYPFDDDADALGHIPYNDKYFAALACAFARFAWRLGRAEKKVVLLDCDNTLWGGVCGEVGAAGIQIDEQHRKLQKYLTGRSDTGTLLCLASKNALEDVEAVFASRDDMVLETSDIVSWKVNWTAKPDNAGEIAAELDLAPDSFVFLDDNPVEIAAMRASLPQVLSVPLPEGDADFGAVLDHCWSLDNHRVTEADKLRKANYQTEGKRRELMQSSASFENFLEGLELQVDIAEIEEGDIPRVSQMTNRTNQFNATTRRMSESEVRVIAGRPGAKAYTCRVKDRFGDYGLVGCVFLSTAADDPELTDFMLSCRVLGRGVEHRIMKFVAIAVQGLPAASGRLRVAFSETPKNMPMQNFLDRIGAAEEAGTDYLFDTKSLLALKGPTAAATKAKPKAAAVTVPQTSRITEHDAMLAAWELRTPDRLLYALHAVTHSRGELEMSYVKPRAGVEQKLADIWCSVLLFDEVGRTDRFVDLGGTSLDVVRVHGEILKHFQKDISLPTLLGCPTIAELALTVGDTQDEVLRVGNAKNIAARQRAALKRARSAVRSIGVANG